MLSTKRKWKREVYVYYVERQAKAKTFVWVDQRANSYTQSGSQRSESVQYFHNDLSRAILVSIITSISQIPIMVPLSVYVSELLPVLQ